MSEIYSTVEQLSSKARAAFAGGDGGSGNNILTSIILLSAMLSAIFFWSFSKSVFVNVYPPAALALGLIVGLLPAEGAFFGWRRIRESKADLTSQQLRATTAGLIAAVVCSVFSTIALFVATVPFVPADVAQYSDWLVFLALAIPTPLQVVIIARYAINERGTVENHERAKLAAMGFDAWIMAEQARMQAIIDGINLALDERLRTYGEEVGSQQAQNILNEGRQALLDMGHLAQAERYRVEFWVDAHGWLHLPKLWRELEEAKAEADRLHEALPRNDYRVCDSNGRVVYALTGRAGEQSDPLPVPAANPNGQGSGPGGLI